MLIVWFFWPDFVLKPQLRLYAAAMNGNSQILIIKKCEPIGLDELPLERRFSEDYANVFVVGFFQL